METQSLRRIVNTLQVVDDFAPDPTSIRTRALGLEYAPRDFLGHIYNGIGVDYDPGLGERIGEVVGGPVVVRLHYFRLAMEGDRTTTYIHADSPCSAFAGVLYLNPPAQCTGGTAFWTHRALGWDAMPPPVEADNPLVRPFDILINADGQDEYRWVMNGFAAMRWNRFVTYPTKLFHSRYPQATWGKTPATGRLIWVVFFDRA